MQPVQKNKVRLIGRREYIDFPELNAFGIEAKIDTGAYTSALHCHDVIVKQIDGIPTLCFKLFDPSHPEYNEQEHRFRSFTMKTVKNSFGEAEERYVIRTLVLIGRKKIRCAISLSDRASMRYTVLIGRKMIKNKFIIDVGKIHVGGLLTSK